MSTFPRLLKMAPAEVLELCQNQLDGALQMLAALILTDEEVLEIRLQDDPRLRLDNLKGWARGMCEELLDETYRPMLVAVLKKHGFLTNTHPGFPLGSLRERPLASRELSKTFLTSDKLVQAYARGEGPDREIGERWLKQALLDAGHSEENAEYVSRISDSGRCGPAEAAMERLLLKSKTSERYTFEIQNTSPGNERVLLCIDDKPWNEFTGPVAKGVLQLLKTQKGTP